MAGVATGPDVKDLISGRALGQTRPNVKRMVFRGAAVIAGLVAVAVLTLVLMVQNREEELVAGVQQRVEITATARAEVFATWLEGVAQLATRLTESDLFRLFAAEVGLEGGSTALSRPLRDQLPYMQVAVTDFAEQSDIAGAYLIGPNGQAYLANASAPSLIPSQRSAAQAVYETGRRTVLPLRATENGLALDILFPLTAPQTVAAEGPERTVGVLLITVPANEKLAGVLAPSPLAETGERTRLVQVTAAGAEAVDPSGPPHLRPIPGADVPANSGPLLFARRMSLGGDTAVFSAGAAVTQTPWLVVQEVDQVTALSPLTTYRVVGGGLALLTTVLVAAAFVAVWWRQVGENNRALAVQYHELASQIQAQRRLLDSINDSIEERIGLKDLAGTYIYANPAFARAVGREVVEVVGRDDAAIFGPAAAERLSVSDEEVLATGSVTVTDEEFEVLSKKRFLTVSKVPLRNDDGDVIGIVSVARDVTEIIEQQQKLEKAGRATVTALVHTIEMHDPYLAGHSRRMGKICGEIGRRLSLSEEDIAALEMAANLSQVGKLSIPREILAKEARLSPDEMEILKGHIEHLEATLKDIDFGLPVCETVAQMHERLDGTGYPRALQGDAINMLGRVIGVSDVYCARIEPRVYRPTISSGEAVKILEDNPGKYDPKVVAALRAYADEVEHPAPMAEKRHAPTA